jgi:hypothetical protein
MDDSPAPLSPEEAIQRLFHLAYYVKGWKWGPVAKAMGEVLGSPVPENKLASYRKGSQRPDAGRVLAAVAVILGYPTFEALLGHLELDANMPAPLKDELPKPKEDRRRRPAIDLPAGPPVSAPTTRRRARKSDKRTG